MPSIRVVTDSASDLPASALPDNLSVVPLTIRFGDEELLDGRDLTPKAFWERLGRSPSLPETAAPAPGAFAEAFREAARAGADGVVCVTLSSDLSATFQSAVAAAESVASDIEVRVVDSRGVSMGEGIAVLETCRLAAEGRSLDEVEAGCRDIAGRIRTFGALGSLEALRKGGRIGNATAFLGSLLSIKPIVEVRKGVVEPESRQRTRIRSLQYLVDKVKAQERVERLAVVHSGASDLDAFCEMLAGIHPEGDLLVSYIGPVIGTHTGAESIGVCFSVPPWSRHE